MSQPIQDVQNIVPLSGPQPPAAAGLSAGLRLLKTLLRLLTGLIVAPLLLAGAIISFPIVLADFAFFRLRDRRAGHPQPKGLWEF